MVEDEKNLSPRRHVLLIECREILCEARAVLSATDNLDPPASPTLLAAENGHPSVHPNQGDPLLPANPMPLLG